MACSRAKLPTCLRARDDLEGALDFWSEAGVVIQPARGQVVRLLRSCRSCRTSGKDKRCTGWRADFKGNTAVLFTPTEVRSGWVQPAVTGYFDCRRKELGKWDDKPVAEGTFAVEVRGRDRQLLGRSHVDLANAGQPGPVWHLQSGGKPPGETVGETEISLPRWPSYPMDVVLVLELVLFNFYWDKWSQLRARNPWREAVRNSEDLVLTPYRQRFNDYWRTRSSRHSWLAHQCNQTSGWDPRPR